MPKIHHVYKNPNHAIAESYELVPRVTENDGYEDINTIIRRLTRGELCDLGRGRTEEDPFNGLLERPIDEIKETLDELQSVALADTPNKEALEKETSENKPQSGVLSDVGSESAPSQEVKQEQKQN